VRKGGSLYVAVVLTALVSYFVYQWWFNPNRMIKSRLGDVAAALSVPADEADLGRLTRLAQLRKLATADLHVRVGKDGADLASRDAVLGALSGWATPPGGRNFDFVDVDVRVNSDGTARAFVTAEMTTHEPQSTHQTLDARDVTFSFVKQDSEWLVSEAEVKELPTAPKAQ
jgi:hypothetical protein